MLNKDFLKEIIEDVAQDNHTSPHNLTFSKVREWCRDYIKTLLGSSDPSDKECLENLKKFVNSSAKEFNSFRDTNFLPNATEEDVNSEVAKRAAKVARNQQQDLLELKVFLKEFDQVAAKTLKERVVVKPYNTPKKAKQTRELNLVLSDLHLQSLLQKKNGTLNFGSIEEARRLAAVTKQVCEYKLQHRDETNLNIHILGDIIAGGIHWPREGNKLAHQSAAAMHLLTQAVAYCAAHFPKVTVSVASGNHGRWPNRKDRDAVDKVDSLETVIYSGVKLGTKHIPNVQFNIPETPYYIHKGVGGDLFFTHGDTIINTGNPGHQIKIGSIEQQLNKIKTSLNLNIKLFCCGHVHTPTLIHLGSNSTLLINGALIPPDQYAQSIGIFGNTCGQWIFESVEGFAIGDSRLAIVDESVDKDSTLDSIIQPYLGF